MIDIFVNKIDIPSITDINGATAKIYYTGNSSTFATTTLFGATVPTIANYTINGSQALVNGTNYFWLVYDISAGATVGNVVDAQCTSLNVGGARTPTVTAPAGSRPIVNQVTIGTGTSTGNYPFYINYDYSRSASLLTAAEVGIPTIISQLAWNVSTPRTTNVPIKIYLKTTTASTLTSDTWANMIAGATLVYNGTTSFTPAGWKTIDITDFSYCADNLLVLCEQNIGSYTTAISFYYTTATDMHQTWNQDGSAPTGSGTVGSSRPNIRMDKLPATVIIPNCATYLTPANGASGITCGVNAILTWSPSVTGCNPPTSYDIYFGTNPAPPFVVNQTTLFYNPGTLLPSTTYYWRIVPRNSAGAAACATVWSFTTGATFNASQTTPPIIEGFENCTDLTIVNGGQPNVWIRGSAAGAVRTGSNAMYIHNGGGTDNGITVSNADSVLIKDCWVYAATANGIDVSNSTRTNVEKCVVENAAGNGIAFGTATTRSNISTCIITGCVDGVDLAGTGLTDNILENNIIYNNSGNGIDIVDANVVRTGIRLHHTFADNATNVNNNGTDTFQDTSGTITPGDIDDIVDGVWNEVISPAHISAGTAGRTLRDAKTKATLASLK